MVELESKQKIYIYICWLIRSIDYKLSSKSTLTMYLSWYFPKY